MEGTCSSPAAAWLRAYYLIMDMIRRFPQYLNAPLQLAWWEADVVAVALFSGYAGFFLKGPFYLIIVLQPYLYVRFKKQYPRGL